MALYPPLNFEKDLQTRDTSLVPFIVLGNSSSSFKIISVFNDLSFNLDEKPDPIYPLLLNIPSIKESIDIENRKYKISNVVLNISNVHYNDKRFSDVISDTWGSLVNQECRIFWKSPSTSNYTFKDIEDYSDEDALQVYFGIVRRYDHDNNTVKLTLEDKTQLKLHIDLPLSKDYLTEENGFNSVPDKYYNKPIPIVYGSVDKSPLVISSSPVYDEDLTEGGTVNLIADRSTSSKISTSGLNYNDDNYYDDQIFIYSDHYMPILRKISNSQASFDYGLMDQFYIDYNASPNILKIGLNIYSDYNDLESYHPISENNIICLENLSPSSYKPRNAVGSWLHFGEVISHYTTNTYVKTPDNDGDVGSSVAVISGTGFYVSGGQDNSYQTATPSWPNNNDMEGFYASSPILNNSDYNYGGLVGIDFKFPVAGDSSYEQNIGLLYIKDILYLHSTYIHSDLFAQIRIQAGKQDGEHRMKATGTFGQMGIGGGNTPYAEDNPLNVSESFGLIDLGGGSDWQAAPIVINDSDLSQLYYFVFNQTDTGEEGEYQPYLTGVEVKFDEVRLEHYMLVEDAVNKKFYANIQGRVSNPTAPGVISDIVSTELNQSVANIPTLYSDWKYNFTIDKKINSKKLIEEIASASPFLPRFDNVGGEFKFDVIPETGGAPDHTIKEDSVINFSFSRTKIENVYTKIELGYKWDYELDDFTEFIDPIYIEDYIPSYQIANYGLDSSHSDSTLKIEDSGKYIRDKETANNFAKWKLLWHCNPHLILKVKLPLSEGLKMEIGDLVDFDNELGGIKPYGKEYKSTGISGLYSINGQDVYANFLITSTIKTLEYVEISCIQMHNLSGESNVIRGCMDENACNFVGGANRADPDNPCWYPNEGCDCQDGYGATDYGCGCNNPNSPNTCEEGCDGVVPDCFGECGGTATYDECGVCGGNGLPCEECLPPVHTEGTEVDCTGVCGGSIEIDECGTCGGDMYKDDNGFFPNGACDCDGNTVYDCNGVCGGSAESDVNNGCCHPDDMDCAGVCNGSGEDYICSTDAYRPCSLIEGQDGGCAPNGNIGEVCDQLPSEYACDCDDNELDDCGDCGGDNSSCEDCAGVPNGGAIIGCDSICDSGLTNDVCNNCGGSETDINNCITDPWWITRIGISILDGGGNNLIDHINQQVATGDGLSLGGGWKFLAQDNNYISHFINAYQFKMHVILNTDNINFGSDVFTPTLNVRFGYQYINPPSNARIEWQDTMNVSQTISPFTLNEGDCTLSGGQATCLEQELIFTSGPNGVAGHIGGAIDDMKGANYSTLEDDNLDLGRLYCEFHLSIKRENNDPLPSWGDGYGLIDNQATWLDSSVNNRESTIIFDGNTCDVPRGDANRDFQDHAGTTYDPDTEELVFNVGKIEQHINVQDIVILANGVLASNNLTKLSVCGRNINNDTCTDQSGCPGGLAYGDPLVNVQDIVVLANCILTESCKCFTYPDATGCEE